MVGTAETFEPQRYPFQESLVHFVDSLVHFVDSEIRDCSIVEWQCSIVFSDIFDIVSFSYRTVFSGANL